MSLIFNSYELITGPDLPITLYEHSMVPLGLGQAILGGRSDNFPNGLTKIYTVICSQRICQISLLGNELSSPRNGFVAIPIPDDISGCISKSKIFYNNFLFDLILFLSY